MFRIDMRLFWIKKYSFILGINIIFFLFLTFSLSTILFFFKQEVSPFIIIIAFIFSILLLIYSSKYYLPKSTVYTKFCLLFSFFIFVFLSIYFAGFFYDLSYDGQWYHQEAVINLKNGWNPVWTHQIDNYDVNYPVICYPKYSWILEANIYSFTNNIEQAKALNFLLLISAFLLSLSLLLELKIKILPAFSLSFFAALNPVTLVQLLTFYNDGVLASLVLILVSLQIFLIIKPDKFKYFGLFMCVISLINVKFTGIFYSIILLLVLFGYLVFKCKEKIFRTIFGLFITFCIGILFLGFNPYITNILSYGHPLHPIAGGGRIDIISPNMHPDFVDKNRLFTFIIGLFSEPNNQNKKMYNENPSKLKFKSLFNVHNDSLYCIHDLRIGGFGPLFCHILMLSFFLCFFYLKNNIIPLLLTGVILLSVFINPAPFWARYVPQLWLLPFVVFLCFIQKNYRYQKRLLIFFISIFLFFNVIAILRPLFFRNYYSKCRIDNRLSELKRISKSKSIFLDPGKFKSNLIKFDNNNVFFKIKDKMLDKDYEYYTDVLRTKVYLKNL